MITHRDLADLAAALYGYLTAPAVVWLYRSPDGAPCCIGVIRVGRLLIVVARGSVTETDWVHDAMVRASSPSSHPLWGGIHSGFLEGVDEAWATIQTLLQPGDLLVIAGHSLGAAHAVLIAAEAVQAGVPPVLTVCWGEPSSGFQKLADYLVRVPGVSYQNGDKPHADIDPVTIVPFYLPPLMPYTHRLTRTPVTALPTGGLMSELGLFAWHHFPLYWSVTPPTPIPEE